jgi:hypothetical protein
MYMTARFPNRSIYFQLFCVVFSPQLHHATAMRMIVHCIQWCAAAILQSAIGQWYENNSLIRVASAPQLCRRHSPLTDSPAIDRVGGKKKIRAQNTNALRNSLGAVKDRAKYPFIIHAKRPFPFF